SIPVSGPEYLKYGGDTTCLEIRTKHDDIIIVDAGSGIRRLGNALMTEGRRDYNMFFTHAHWDHLLGFPFFKPIYYPGTEINMFGCPFAQISVQELISQVMAAPHFPIEYQNIRCEISYHQTCGDRFSINEMTVTSFPLSHPNEGMGYRFEEDGKSFVFLTDNELSYIHPGGRGFDDYVGFAAGADLLIHDAEFREDDYKQTWGHSTYNDAVRLALAAGVKTLGLFHHNQERTDVGVDDILARSIAMVRECQGLLTCCAVYRDMQFIV
ncbi:MAG TPA: MBL fold metallo-hydrolase, partial [Syntrophales bacterium]|nr:MBL fold metallo-hydrolase [Syntrophales bacterium]